MSTGNQPDSNLLIRIVIFAACIGLVVLGIHYFQIPIPTIVWQVLGIIAVAALIILGIRFLQKL